MKKNDKFILSKSHASFPLCILLRKKGYNPKLSTHLEIDKKNGINCTTGSLGHGLPIATGMALANKLRNKKGKILSIVGFDGGKLKNISDNCIYFKCDKNEYGPIEDIHLIINHILAHWFQKKL